MTVSELSAGDRFVWAKHEWMSLGTREDGAIRAILLTPIEGVALPQSRVHAWLQKYFVPALGDRAKDIRPVRLPEGGRAYVSLPPIEAIQSAARLFVPPEGVVMSCSRSRGRTLVFDGDTRRPLAAADTLSFRVQPAVVLNPDTETDR